MAQAVEEWYKQMPIITRSYLTAAVVTTVGCSLEVWLLPLIPSFDQFINRIALLIGFGDFF